MFELSDRDFLEEIPVDEIFDSVPAVTRAMFEELEEIGLPRCTCGKVLNQATRIYDKVRAKAREIKQNTGRPISEDEYAEIMSKSIKEEPGIQRICCKNIIESTPRIVMKKGGFIGRPIDREEILLKQERTFRDGNIIVTRFDPKPYNPYSYTLDVLMDNPGKEGSGENEELARLRKKEAKRRKGSESSEESDNEENLQIEELDNFPSMPPFGDDEGFEEEVIDLYSNIESEYVVYGFASTGLEGMEVPIIRSTKISAR